MANQKTAENIPPIGLKEDENMKKWVAILMVLCLANALGFACAAETPVSITFSDSGAQCADKAVLVEANTVSIKAPGVYQLIGAWSDGQVIVDSENEGDVMLILNGVTIHCERSAAIFVKQCASDVVLMLADGTVNALSGGAEYDLDAEDEPNAVLFSRDDLEIDGNGKLTVTAPFMDGIVSKDDLLFENGDFVIDAARNGIRGKDSVEIHGGTFVINAGNDGIKSTNAKEPSRGYVAISGGDITITCVDDPLSAVTKLSITGGTVNATLVAEN